MAKKKATNNNKKNWETRRKKQKIATLINDPKGRGNFFDGEISPELAAKRDFLERAGLEVETKISNDGKLIYLSTEVGASGEGLELAASGPSGFLYRASTIVETQLTLTKEYKLIMKSGGAYTRKFRAIGTLKEEQMTEIRLEPSRDLVDEANKIFGLNSTKLVGVSILIMQPKGK